jgi:hypothetical protein
MELLAHLPEVKHRLLHKIQAEDHERERIATIELEMLPYSIAAAHHSCIQVVRAQLRVVEQVFRNDENLRAVFVMSPTQQRELSFAIDAFLESARRAQNSLVPYLSRAFEVSLPSSLSDAVNSLGKGKVSLPASIADLLLGYWHKHGKRLKEFRDVSQHHSIVASDARVLVSDDGHRGLRLLLPSNPELKTTSKLVFGEPPIHAVPYVREQFLKLLATAYCLTHLILDLVPGDRGQVVTALIREPLILGTPVEGHRLFTEEQTQQAITSTIKRVRAKYEAHIRPSALAGANA